MKEETQGSAPGLDPVAPQDSTSKFDMLPSIILTFSVNPASLQENNKQFILFGF
jgi:hypothetical protein